MRRADSSSPIGPATFSGSAPWQQIIRLNASIAACTMRQSKGDIEVSCNQPGALWGEFFCDQLARMCPLWKRRQPGCSAGFQLFPTWYCRLPVGRASVEREALGLCRDCGLEIRDTAQRGGAATKHPLLHAMEERAGERRSPSPRSSPTPASWGDEDVKR